jgi:hypothetical protein
VYPDRGYDGAWYRARLVERGIADGVMPGDDRQRPLDAAGRARNRALGVIRAPVERTCAILKCWYGYRRARYRSLIKSALQLQLLAVALNLRPGAERLRAEGGLRPDPGRSAVRPPRYMAALVASRSNPMLRATYQRLLANAKPRKFAPVALMRKMLVTLNAMLRSATPWRHLPAAA